MSTDHDLDVQLQAARGLRDADLPALPAAFLDFVHASTATPEQQAPAVRALHPVGAEAPASVLAAQQLVADAHQRRSSGATGGRRRPSRKTALRLSAAVIAVAAAWTTAVVVIPSDRPSASPDVVASPSADPTAGATGIRLVATEAAMFPLSLDPVPAGLTPSFSQRGEDTPDADTPLEYVADYRPIDGDGDGFTLWTYPQDPRGRADFRLSQDQPDRYDSVQTATVSVHGSPVEIGLVASGTNTYADLLWQQPNGWWVRILGDGVYAETGAVVAVAESVVDRPQPLGLQFGLAPAGWTASSYEDSHSIDLVNDEDPDQLLRLSVYRPGPGTTIESFIESFFEDRDVFVSPVTPVTIKGLPGLLSLRSGDTGQPSYWFVVGQFPDGRVFLLLAPRELLQEQVLAIAEQIIYTP